MQNEIIKSAYADAKILLLDLQGWHSDLPIFEDAIVQTCPKIIIEVGVWKGASAVHMARLCRSFGFDTVIYAVDFFDDEPRWDIFRSNVKQLGLDDCILPIKGTSAEVAAGPLSLTRADLIYLDADHTHGGVLADLHAYWPLLKRGGILIGDDFHEEPGVKSAVMEFCAQNCLAWTDVRDKYHFTIEKP